MLPYLTDMSLSYWAPISRSFFAAASGPETTEELLLCPSIDPNQTLGNNSEVSSHVAAYIGDSPATLDVVRLLLSSDRTDPNLQGLDGRNALMSAARQGFAEQLILLLDDPRIDVSRKDEAGRTALILAAQRGQVLATALLLDHRRLNPNQVMRDGRPALTVACAKGFQEVVALLTSHPRTDLNVPNHQGRTCLFSACLAGHTAIVKHLLQDLRLNCDHQDHAGKTALMVAIENNQVAVVRTLLESGRVDLNLKCHNGNSALTYTMESKHVHVLSSLLIDHRKTNPNVVNDDGQTPLCLAAHKGGHEGHTLTENLLYSTRTDVDVKYKVPGPDTTARAIAAKRASLPAITTRRQTAKKGHVKIAESIVDFTSSLTLGDGDTSFTGTSLFSPPSY